MNQDEIEALFKSQQEAAAAAPVPPDEPEKPVAAPEPEVQDTPAQEAPAVEEAPAPKEPTVAEKPAEEKPPAAPVPAVEVEPIAEEVPGPVPAPQPKPSVEPAPAPAEAAQAVFISDGSAQPRPVQLIQPGSQTTKLMAIGSLVVGLFAVGLAYHGISKSEATLLESNRRADELLSRVKYVQTVNEWRHGGAASEDYPLWNANYHGIDLDRELLVQVPTRCGPVNVVRGRPASLNNRNTLKLRITNPNMVTMCRGQLMIRTADTELPTAEHYDHVALGQWYRQVRKQMVEIKDLGPGESQDLEVAVDNHDGSSPAHVDFQVLFEYFKEEGSDSKTAAPPTK